jgi:hypothetical protein
LISCDSWFSSLDSKVSYPPESHPILMLISCGSWFRRLSPLPG